MKVVVEGGEGYEMEEGDFFSSHSDGVSCEIIISQMRERETGFKRARI